MADADERRAEKITDFRSEAQNEDERVPNTPCFLDVALYTCDLSARSDILRATWVSPGDNVRVLDEAMTPTMMMVRVGVQPLEQHSIPPADLPGTLAGRRSDA